MGSLLRFNPKDYGCNIYIETGTGSGSCLDKAIQANVFDRYYSVDLDSDLAMVAKKKFPFVNIEIGKSIDILEKWLSSDEISKKDKILFFLDAHFPGADFRGAKYDVSVPNAVPLEEELKLIKKYRENCQDYIICDDARIYQIDSYQNGNVEWLQVPGGISFLYELFPKENISIDLADEGYILIDNR
jgi:hypothetical protein